MPLIRTDEIVTPRELNNIRGPFTHAKYGPVETDYGEYRYDESACLPWSPTDNGMRWRFWKYID